jgi:serine/threonine protein kinase
MIESRSGDVFLIDYGFSVYINEGDEEEAVGLTGSLPYMAPEVYSEETYNPFKVDIFSIGVVAYALLSGKFPFEEPNKKQNVVSYPPHISQKGKRFLKRMLDFDPENRPSAKELCQDPWLKKTFFK